MLDFEGKKITFSKNNFESEPSTLQTLKYIRKETHK
jgi:hypothetical protein